MDSVGEKADKAGNDENETPLKDSPRKEAPTEGVPQLETDETSPQEPAGENDPDEDEDDEDEAVLQEKLQTLKGDRIGETMYSERFVLSTILKLSQQADRLLEDDEEFERDLCNLWDMTIEPDVVRFLLQQDVIELFLALAADSKDFRLIEILFGIIGNMCCVEEMHDLFYRQSGLLVTLCDFLGVTDAPVLVQLMRTLTTLFDRSDDERFYWFGVMKKVDNLTEKIALILATSTNRALLEHAVETVNAMINRFTEAEVDYAQLNEFYRLFAKSCLLEGLFEAFRQLYPPAVRDEATAFAEGNGFDEETLTLKDVKTMRRFMEIHNHFIVNANELYEPYVNEVDQCIQRVLASFVSEAVLFPVTKNHVSIFVSISNIYSGIMYHFRAESFVHIVRIYDLLSTALKNPPSAESLEVASSTAEPKPNAPMEEDDQEDDGGEFDVETACAEVREAIFFLVGPIDEQIIRAAIRAGQLKESTFEQLCRELRESMDGEPLLYQTCAKLMNAARSTPESGDSMAQSENHATAQE